jgi:uncharacterized oxidoreductase
MQAYARSAEPAQGFDHVLLPGDPERASKAARLADGIPIDPQSWQAICQAGEKAGMTAADMAGFTK